MATQNTQSNTTNWIAIVLAIITTLAAAFGITFGITQANNATAQEKLRIDAQNQVAQMSKVHQEDRDTWSRLAQQYTDLSQRMQQQDSNLNHLIESRNEQIQSISNTIANMRPVHIITNNVTQTPIPGPNGERIRVDFDEMHENYIHVHGYTLTNPGAADLTIEFTQPLHLRTTITQARDGSWRNYVTTNWPDLQISNIETVVNPLIVHPRQWFQNILFGTSLNITTSFNGFDGSLYVLYDFGQFAIGPNVGTFIDHNGGNIFFGLTAEWRPL